MDRSAQFEVVYCRHASYLPAALSMLSTLGPTACSPRSSASLLELPRKLRGIAHEGRRLLDGILVLSVTPVETLITCGSDDTWLIQQLLDHILLPRCRICRVLMEKVSPIPHLLTVELNKEGQMFNCCVSRPQPSPGNGSGCLSVAMWKRPYTWVIQSASVAFHS